MTETRSGRAAAPSPLGSLPVFLPAQRIVPPHTSERGSAPLLAVPQQAGVVGVSRAQVTASQVRSVRAVAASHPSEESEICCSLSWSSALPASVTLLLFKQLPHNSPSCLFLLEDPCH